MATGYFADPATGRATKVHACLRPCKNFPIGRRTAGPLRPICGARVGPGMEYQPCGPGFNGAYIDCGSCRRILGGVL
jgi:hypothetical protein